MILNSDVHIVTGSLKPVKDSLTSSECPTCNHPVAHVLKAVQYVHLQSWKLIFHSQLQTKFSISLNICERDLNCWLKIYFHFFVKGLRNNSAALLHCSLRILFSEYFKAVKRLKRNNILHSVLLHCSLRIPFFCSSHLAHQGCVKKKTCEIFFGRNCP